MFENDHSTLTHCYLRVEKVTTCKVCDLPNPKRGMVPDIMGMCKGQKLYEELLSSGLVKSFDNRTKCWRTNLPASMPIENPKNTEPIVTFGLNNIVVGQKSTILHGVIGVVASDPYSPRERLLKWS